MVRGLLRRPPRWIVYGSLGFLIPCLMFLFAVWPMNAQSALGAGVHKTTLANGVTVLIKEISTAPVVSLQVWYRVGSAQEPQGQNGIAHQLEHLMFRGTESRPIQFGQLFNALGSVTNAFTSYDMTAYHHTVRADQLKSLLVLEADRMVNSQITPENLETEKRVVISELQGYENSPDYRLSRAMMAELFPDHPYGLTVGGTASDVAQFTLEQVQDFYRQYYRPDNTVVVITGGIDAPQALGMVKETFGELKNPDRPAPTATLPSSQSPPGPIPVVTLQEPGSAPFVQILYPLPGLLHPDGPALGVLDTLLTEGRSSRLYQALVETGKVSAVNSYAAMLREGGWFEIAAIANTSEELTLAEAVIQETLETLQTQPVPLEELQRAKNQLRATSILRSRDIDSQASQLAYDQTVAGDYYFSDRLLAAIETLTPADIQRVAQTYFQPQHRAIGRFQPTEFTDDGGMPLSGRQTTEHFYAGEPVNPASVAQYLPHGVQPLGVMNLGQLDQNLSTFTLKNGLRILLLVDQSTPTITLAGRIQAGTAYDLLTTPGLASLTADNLLNGTQTQDALTLAKTLENKGMTLDFSAFRDGVDIEGYALSEDLATLLTTLAEVLQAASFPNPEFATSQQRALTGINLEMDNPMRLGRRIFQQTLYPKNHPLYPFPTVDSVQGIQRQDLIHFYRQAYSPDQTLLTLVGNFDPDAVRSLLVEKFASWQPSGPALTLNFPKVPLPNKTIFVNQVIPGKPQAITYMGTPGIDRRDPRFYAALLLNHIIGGDTLSSRLGVEIRDRLGLTYGIYSFFAAGPQAGPFIIQMQTAPDDTPQAIQATLSLLRDLREQGVTAAELDAAKRSLMNSYPVELASIDTLARSLLANALVDLDPEEVLRFPDRLAAVTLAEVNQALKELIHPDQMVIVSTGPPVAFESGAN